MIGKIYKDKNDNHVKVVAKAMLVYTNENLIVYDNLENLHTWSMTEKDFNNIFEEVENASSN